MSLNKILQRDDRRVANTIKTLSRNVREMKTPQQSGADVLPLAVASLTSFGPITIASNNSYCLFIRIIPSSPLLTLWNFLFTVYVDSDDAAHAFPYGPNLTNGQQSARVTGNADYLNFNQSTNQQAYVIRIENYDTVTHNYFIDFLTATPKAH